MPGAGLLIVELSAGRIRAREFLLKTSANAVLIAVGEFKARTSILDRILNAKQLAGSRGGCFGSPHCHCEPFGCSQDKLREAITAYPNEIASGLRPSQ